ncbi:MAG: CAP domain-containing protein, partial [Syntrophales bacterium]
MRILSILLLTATLLGGANGTVSAAEGLPSPQDEALLGLINQARQNPLAVAASMGMDIEKILKDLPQLEKILREGLPPVTFSVKLAEAARAHTQDMFANGYYSHYSPDGRGYDARIRDTGYLATATGESLGMLAFANFIDPKDAAQFIFEYMFWDELDPLRTEKRNILDPRLKEAGINIDTGVLSLGGTSWNVYLATCDFGTVISEPEDKILQQINQARVNPLA